MAEGYVLIAGVLFYILLIRMVDSNWVGFLKAAVLWAVGYYLLSSFVLGIGYLAHDVPLALNLLSPVRITTAVAQLLTVLIVFYRIEEGSSDSYTSFMLWGSIGLALVFFVVPTLVQGLFMSLLY